MCCGSFVKVFVLCVLFQTRSCIEKWSQITLHCRDDGNIPTDWWYIVKPPSPSPKTPDTGLNFSYINSGVPSVRWKHSTKPINKKSMLINTIKPLYQSSYEGHLAVLAYTESKGKMGTSAMGILVADDSGGGFWLGHTMSGFPDLAAGKAMLPSKELKKGQLFACITLTAAGLNTLAAVLDKVAPSVTELRLPQTILPMLPAWQALQLQLPLRGTQLIYGVSIKSRGGKVFYLMARIPGDKRCLYEAFAKLKRIVLDVYGQTFPRTYNSVCGVPGYGVRNIDSISMKYSESDEMPTVQYIRDHQDRSRFAVSTAAHWQFRGSAGPAYWACVSNLDKEDTNSPGGLLVCVEDFGIWRAFDSLKVSEPTC